MTLTRIQIHDLLYLVRVSSFVPSMTKNRQEALELSLSQQRLALDKPQGFLGTTNFQNFEDLKTKDKHLATIPEKLKNPRNQEVSRFQSGEELVNSMGKINACYLL